MKETRLPPLSLLYNEWREDGRFFFLKKFLDESRSSFGAAEDSSPVFTSSAGGGVGRHIVAAMVERISALANFLVLIAQVMGAPKGKILIFNHTKRVRRGCDTTRPLYISKTIDLTDSVVFENANVDYALVGPVRHLQSSAVTRTSEITSAFVTRLTGRRQQSDRDIANFVVAYVIWRLIFRLLKPRSIRLFVWYGKESVVLAAKSLGIDVADVQHGIIYPSHPFYSIKTTAANSDYLLPNRCLVYGEYWRELLIKSGWKSSQVEVVGYFLDIESGQTPTLLQPYILYTSQPHTSRSICEHIRSILPQVNEMGYRIVIAPHPSEAQGIYGNILGNCVSIAENCDSYDLLRHCAVHVSVSSTLLWEAMIFGKSSYVLEYGREAVDLLSDFVKFGYGRSLSKNMFPHPFCLPESPASEYFFAPVIDKFFMSDTYIINSKNGLFT